MKKYIAYIIIILVNNFYASEGGKIGFTYLKTAVNARASAMGEAHTALASDASATYWNPANLTQSETNSVVLSHNTWLLDITHNFVSVQLIHGTHNIAFSLNVISIPGIEIRDYTASKDPIGRSSVYNLYLGASYAIEFSDKWSIGTQLKYYYEKMYLVSARGLGIDLGILGKNVIKDLDWGLSIQNIGEMGKLLKTSTELPLLIRTGVGYLLPWKIADNNIIAAADVVYILNDSFRFNIGTEVKLINQFFLRLGYILGSDSYNFTTGFGLQLNRFQLSYAFVPFKYDLENSHRFSININFD
jgi:hypothetical protein